MSNPCAACHTHPMNHDRYCSKCFMQKCGECKTLQELVAELQKEAVFLKNRVNQLEEQLSNSKQEALFP